MPTKIPIPEEFDRAEGRLLNYDTYDLAHRTAIPQQKHVNVRSFHQEDLTLSAITIFYMDLLSMSLLDGETMEDLEGELIYQRGEQWFSSPGSVTVAKQSDRNHLRGLSLPCTTGANTLTSIIRPVVIPYLNAPTGYHIIDMSNFADDDSITVALPAFPYTSVNLSQTFLDFTSHPTGDFTVGPTDSVSFTGRVTPAANGDCEFLFPLSLLTTIDRSQITGVRFRIQVTGSCTFRCLGFRCVSKTWKYARHDIDTINNQLIRPPSRTGSITAPFEFPLSSITPADWPVLFRADDPPASSDPKPIDVHLSAAFNTGSVTAGPVNTLTFQLREFSLDYLTQLDLDPSSTDSTTQAELNALGHQPDFGRAMYSSREQQELDVLTQEEINTENQSDLERTPDPLSAAFIEVVLAWGATSTLSVRDSEGNGYDFTAAIDPLTDYIMFIDLVENSIRARIYEMNSAGDINWSVLAVDSTQIIDDSLIKRRQGRIGWGARFEDGDVILYNIRTRGLNFAEHRTNSLNSITPVEGAQLYVAATPPIQLFTGLSPGPYGGTVVPDEVQSRSQRSYKVTNFGDGPLQGIQSNLIYFDDFPETEIEFDLLFPQNAIDKNANLIIFLLGEYGRIVPLNVGVIKGDRWQHIQLQTTPTAKVQTGSYRLVWVQIKTGVKTTWYIDNINITQRAINWSGRPSIVNDEIIPDNWIPYNHVISSNGAGVLFKGRGRSAQIRAQALQQNAVINRIKIVPKYAELGRFIWSGNEVLSDIPDIPPLPTLDFSWDPVGDTFSYTVDGNVYVTETVKTPIETPITFTPIVALASGVTLTEYYWRFGDGTESYATSPVHTFYIPFQGTRVILRVTDNFGRVVYTSHIMNVTSGEESGFAPAISPELLVVL